MRLALAAIAIALVPLATGQTWSAFTGQTSSSANSLEAARIFEATHTTSAWRVDDNSTGSLTYASDAMSFAGDGWVVQTNALPTAFDPAKHVALRFEKGVPRGLPLSGATLRADLMHTGAAGTLSFAVEVRRPSTSTVLATYGDATNPAGSTTGTGAFSIPLPVLNSTTDLKDLSIRIIAWDSAGTAMYLDRVTLSGSSPHQDFTLMQDFRIDRFGTSAVGGPWRLAAADTSMLTTGAWVNAFQASRYLKLTFDPDVPAGAKITGVTLRHGFRPTTNEQCVHYEARSGGAVIGTYFSAASPSCHADATTFKTDVLSLLTEVDTAAELNGLEIRVYGRNAGKKASEHDLVTLDVGYFLP